MAEFNQFNSFVGNMLSSSPVFAISHIYIYREILFFFMISS